jgi:hypothetical protein
MNLKFSLLVVNNPPKFEIKPGTSLLESSSIFLDVPSGCSSVYLLFAIDTEAIGLKHT